MLFLIPLINPEQKAFVLEKAQEFVGKPFLHNKISHSGHCGHGEGDYSMTTEFCGSSLALQGGVRHFLFFTTNLPDYSRVVRQARTPRTYCFQIMSQHLVYLYKIKKYYNFNVRNCRSPVVFRWIS